MQQGQGLSLFTNLIQDFKTLALGPEVCKHSILLSFSCLDGLWSLSIGHGVALKDNLWVVPPLPSDTPTHFCVKKFHQSAWKWHWKKVQSFNIVTNLFMVTSSRTNCQKHSFPTHCHKSITALLGFCHNWPEVHCSYWAVQRTYWKIIWVGLFSQFGVSVTPFPSPRFSLLCYLFFHSVIFLVCIQSNA